MKKFFALTALMVLLTSTSAFALIVNSGHDFTSLGWTNEICAPCHTPHNAIAGAGPLWSHATSGQTFTMYNNAFSSTIDMTIAGQPQGISMACLSCHDGVTFMDDFIGTTSATPSVQMAAITANLGTDLTNDHPISITYDNTVDTAFRTIAIASAAPYNLVFFGTNQVECATCHDVHNGTAIAAMLRSTNVGSQLCLGCHIK